MDKVTEWVMVTMLTYFAWILPQSMQSYSMRVWWRGGGLLEGLAEALAERQIAKSWCVKGKSELEK